MKVQNTKTTLLIIDDHPMLRAGIKQLINTTQQFDIIGEAGDGEEGIKLAKEKEPDLILLDISMKGISGLDVLYQLKQQNPISSKIIMFTVSNEQNNILFALKNGADGYLLKDMEPELFLEALLKIVNNNVILEDSIMQSLLSSIKEKKSTNLNSPDLAQLTIRERDTFDLLVMGLSNKSIANQLSIVESTVKVHVKNIFKKLNFKSRVEMMLWFHNKE